MLLIKFFQNKIYKRYKNNYKKFLKIKKEKEELQKKYNSLKITLYKKEDLINKQNNNIEQLKENLNPLEKDTHKELSITIENTSQEKTQKTASIKTPRTFFDLETNFANFLWDNYKNLLLEPKQLYLNTTRSKAHTLFILNIDNVNWYFLCLSINNIDNKEYLSKEVGIEAISKINQYTNGNNNKIVLVTNRIFKDTAYSFMYKKANDIFSSSNSKFTIYGFSKLKANFKGLIFEEKIFQINNQFYI